MNKQKIDLDNDKILRSENVEYNNQVLKDYLDKVTVYSNEEQVIGKWVDGKPIYRKTINVGTPSAAKSYLQHGISNVKDFINAHGRCIVEDGSQQMIPSNYTNWEIWLYDFTSTIISLYFSNNQWANNPTNVQITLEYTKTTD